MPRVLSESADLENEEQDDEAISDRSGSSGGRFDRFMN